MTRTQVLSNLWILLGAVTYAMFVSNAGSEDVLVKQKERYLGWRTGEAEFKTCSENRIRIGNGIIEKTKDKCPKDRGPGPFLLKGTVESVDPKEKTLEVKSSQDGKSYRFYYPRVAEGAGAVELQDLKRGDRVAVSTPTTGRAEAVFTEAHQDK